MITSIEISKTASYGSVPEVLSNLSKVNFLFGTNGAGKSTIANIIATADEYLSCHVHWTDGVQLQTIVYDRNFVRRNYEQSENMKGVFTLGEEQVEAEKEIAIETRELEHIRKELTSLRSTLQGEDGLGGKLRERQDLEEELKGICWRKKQKHDTNLSKALEGFRSSAEKFKEKVLEERKSNVEELIDLRALEEKASRVFGPTPLQKKSIDSLPSAVPFNENEISLLLQPIVGKDDVDVAGLIKRLSNSDWVQRGRQYLQISNPQCPFCQQNVTAGLEAQLNDYFDEMFTANIATLNRLYAEYRSQTDILRMSIDMILGAASENINQQRFTALKSTLDATVAKNLTLFDQKVTEPSRSVSLGGILIIVDELNELIIEANESIDSHNKIISRLTEEQQVVKRQVWRYILDAELEPYLHNYDSKRANLEAGISSLQQKISAAVSREGDIAKKIAELEKKTTSIQPTVTEINRILKSFGFESFSLRVAPDGKHYILVRADGSDARESLSEGEKSFLTFLYFFHLLRGSTSTSGVATDRIVVFDDPVSSLDADILFVVSSLIRSVISDVNQDIGNVKQTFVFTHNVYFHREVTFEPSGKHGKRFRGLHWTVRKVAGNSRLQEHQSNPIKTLYQLLWEDVRNPNRPPATLQNILRRILENYFTMLGEVDRDEICGTFEGRDKLLCASLFSWINAGSHHAHDDLFISSGDAGTESYLRVFKAIFENTGHGAHFRMMMGLQAEEPANQQLPPSLAFKGIQTADTAV